MQTVEKSYISGRNVRAFDNFQGMPEDLEKIGISIAMDAVQNPVLPSAIVAPIQFLQTQLPGFVRVATAAMKIDEILGILTAGSWEDEEVIQGVMETLSTVQPYGDYSNIPLSSFNPNFERRSVVRFEAGEQAGILEEARAARINANAMQMKREAAVMALEINRNLVGFNGYNSGTGRTYGLLNDPNLPAYVTFPNGLSGSALWQNKTLSEITNDLRISFAALRVQSQDTIDVANDAITMVIPTSKIEYLTTNSDFGYSVRKWLNDNYKNVRIISCPQFILANGGSNSYYLFAENVGGASTDDGRVFTQIVPTKFKLVGTQQTAKGYKEDYSNALAGIMLKRPWAIVRFTGL